MRTTSALHPPHPPGPRTHNDFTTKSKVSFTHFITDTSYETDKSNYLSANDEQVQDTEDISTALTDSDRFFVEPFTGMANSYYYNDQDMFLPSSDDIKTVNT